MFPYWVLFGIFAAGALQHAGRAPVEGQSVRPGPLILLGGVLIALMIGLRYEVGGDWFQYNRMFEETGYLDLETAITLSDPGYSLLNWAVGAAGLGIWAVNLTCGAIFTWGLVRLAKAQPNPALAISIAIPYLIIVVAMGYTRQAVAIGVIMGGIAVLDRISILRFAVYILVAVAFHKSAIIVLPLIALAAVRHRLATIALIMVTGALLYYLFVDASVDRLFLNYVEQDMQSQGAAIRVAMNLPPAALFLLFQGRFGFSDLQRKIWRNFAIGSVVMLFLLLYTTASTAVDRIALYLIPMQIAVLSRVPQAIQRGDNVSVPIVTIVLIYSAIIQFVWLNYAFNAEHWLPYQSFLFLD